MQIKCLGISEKYQKVWFFVSDSAGLQIELAMLCQSDTCENDSK